jgi:GNAT superfamily N-acetyltransferase
VAEIEVRLLDATDDRTTFRSGNDDLDRYFHRFAGQNQFRHHVGTTYVALVDGAIVGYATVVAGQIETATLPASVRRRLPSYPLPALRLARLAVDERSTGSGIGLALIRAVFITARRMAEDVGCVGVLVDAKPPAVPFYERYGFVLLEIRAGALGDRPEPLPMFLRLKDIPRPTDRPA